MPGRIFISYRRQETRWPARQLYDVLVEQFPAEQVFKDVDSIEPGEDFVERITAAVSSCDVLLALIGEQWLTITDENGQRRLDDPRDYVRVEIETALTRKIRVIPILVDDARMPRVRRAVHPPIQVETAAWSRAGQLDWWVKERQEWMGRVRGADGRQRWIRAADLVPRAESERGASHARSQD